MDRRIRITDVSPRDGLQNEPLRPTGPVPTSDKARLVRMLVESGVDEIELTSFVRPDLIPQLADADEVIDAVAAGLAGGWRSSAARPVLSVLVPNERGMARVVAANQRARAAHGLPIIDRVAVFSAASETFSKRNTNATISQTLDRFEGVLDLAREHGLGVRGYVSCAIACPFEGPIDPAQVADVAARLWELGRERGLDEIDLGDTIGAGTPQTVARMVGAVQEELHHRITAGIWAMPRLTLHLHDTFGAAGACAAEAFRLGVRSFDAAVGGLGGCPFASTPTRRAPGNVDTQVLVGSLVEVGASTALDRPLLARASEFARTLGQAPIGHPHAGSEA